MDVKEALTRLQTLEIVYPSDEDLEAMNMAKRSLAAWDKVEMDIWKQAKNLAPQSEERRAFACGMIHTLREIIHKHMKGTGL